jgi:TolA-binding protein
LQPADSPGSRFTFPSRREDLDPRTTAAIERILAATSAVEPSQTALVILPEDREEPEAETVGLNDILQDHLLAGDYAGAESKLQGFLNLRRSAYTEARVRFYLAQAYYFQGLYEEALFEFVLAQDQLYAPVQPWIESCFRHLWERR